MDGPWASIGFQPFIWIYSPYQIHMVYESTCPTRWLIDVISFYIMSFCAGVVSADWSLCNFICVCSFEIIVYGVFDAIKKESHKRTLINVTEFTLIMELNWCKRFVCWHWSWLDDPRKIISEITIHFLYRWYRKQVSKGSLVVIVLNTVALVCAIFL